MLFLRFTTNPQRDLTNGASMWFIYEPDEVDRLRAAGKSLSYIEEVGEWAMPHSGLSGHALEADTLEEAIEEVMGGVWFGDVKTDSWAIFEGEFAPAQDTPEGDTFTPEAVLNFAPALDPAKDMSL